MQTFDLTQKKLYQANGYAVKEMLRIAKVLYDAMSIQKKAEAGDAAELSVTELFDAAKRKQLQEGRSLASQLASSGASLHTLLGKEADLRDSRNSSIRRQLDSTWVEERVLAARDALHTQVQKMETSLLNVTKDEAALDEKIEKKQNELERNRKRLSTLQSVRPAYMEEYEQLEEELSALYSFYLTRFRNLSFLESQYEELVKSGVASCDDMETTFRTITQQIQQNVKKSAELIKPKPVPGNKYGEPRGRQSNNSDKSEKIDSDNNDESEDDDDDDENDLVDGQNEDDDDDDDDDEEDEDEDSEDDEDAPSVGRKPDRVGGIGRTMRNQLAPGWSPSRQRVPAASYHGRSMQKHDDGFTIRNSNTEENLPPKRDKSLDPTDSVESRHSDNAEHDPQAFSYNAGKNLISNTQKRPKRNNVSRLSDKSTSRASEKDQLDEEDDDF